MKGSRMIAKKDGKRAGVAGTRKKRRSSPATPGDAMQVEKERRRHQRCPLVAIIRLILALARALKQ